MNWNQDFEKLKSFFEVNEVVNPILIGDLNVRIGEEQQVLDDLIEASFPAGLEIRKSKDKVLNSYGKKLMEFCNNYGLVIMNGRTAGDEEGSLTFLGNMGSSVNDICAVSMDVLSHIAGFEVEQQIWSDHLPIKLSFANFRTQNPTEKMNLLPKLKWNSTNKANYIQKLNSNLTNLLDAKASLDLVDMTNLIVESYGRTSVKNKGLHPKNKWFDRDCIKARDESMRLLKRFQKSHNPQDEQKYLQCKSTYKKLCNNKKKVYMNLIERKINTVSDSKEWWSLVKEIRQQEGFTVGSINGTKFREYFKRLLNPPVCSAEIHYAPNLNMDHELDMPFTVAEIKNQLKKAKPNKAPGEDRIPYEFFINASNDYLEVLADVFTQVLNARSSYDVFKTSIIFPIYKKGDANQENNYRGISFMNCIAKIMMGILNERITDWVNRNQILNEFQAGFRKGYSTIDNIYNLSAIVNIEFSEKKKVYAFFVDFKAAFDRIPRSLLIYKLHQMGLSTKVVNFIDNIYRHTKSAVWTGVELTDSFETLSGVKQGCLLSPLLFALYLNDLHDQLGGGLFIDDLNIRVLMYADDIVILADDVKTLQEMINKLESYCCTWGMEVNLAKSDIMIFRRGGKVASREQWTFNGLKVTIVSEYKYLGIILTPKMSFSKHVLEKNKTAKTCLNMTWKTFIGKRDISLKAKWKMFLAVCRSIQSYGCQIWGNSWFEEVDILQRYFTKRVLKLGDNTPNYVLMLETGQEEGHYYTYCLHLKYILKTLFEYNNNRLPHSLSKTIIQRKIYWFDDLINKFLEHGIDIDQINTESGNLVWKTTCVELVTRMKAESYQNHLAKAQQSQSRIYQYLDHTKGLTYCNEHYNQTQISYIMKARGDLLLLNGNQYRQGDDRLCSMCNLREIESTQHFIGKCPVLKFIRVKYLKRLWLNEDEVVNILNGEDESWLGLYKYIKEALKYRSNLIREFNY